MAYIATEMIVVVGLGNMGLALARRLTMRGREVVGVDSSLDRLTIWTLLTGKRGVSSPDQVDWKGVARVLVVVRTEDQVTEALDAIRAQAESAGLRDVPVHVITTMTPEVARQLPTHASSALRIIENPITGGEAPALLGTQTAMLAGAFEESDIAFLKDGLMEEVVTFDAHGEPALAKLLNNLTCAYNLAAFGAVIKIGGDAGLDVTRLSKVILHGSGASYAGGMVVSMLGDLLAKDVDLATQAIGRPPLVDPGGIEAQLAALRARLGGS